MNKKSGFTLVEVLIVVTIIALLASLAVPGYLQHTRRARASEAVASMALIRQAMRDYFIVNDIHYDVDSGNLANDLPLKANITVATGDTVAPDAAAGVKISIGIAQYFSGDAFSIDAIDHASARFTTPGPQNFIITADGSASVACGAADCAMNQSVTDDYRLEMDDTGRVFVSFDGGTNWTSY